MRKASFKNWSVQGEFLQKQVSKAGNKYPQSEKPVKFLILRFLWPTSFAVGITSGRKSLPESGTRPSPRTLGLQSANSLILVIAAACTGIQGNADAQTVKRLAANGPQPIVVTPQGVKRPLYKESHALLISVANYKGPAEQGWQKLPNTTTEVDKLATALRRHGFNIWRVEDPNAVELRSVLRDFIAQFGQQPDNRLLFLFSGHGYTNPNNDFGYLVPADATDPNVSFKDFQRAAMPIAEIELLAKEIESRHALFLFDSCFSGSIFAGKSSALKADPRAGDVEDRWRFLTGKSSKPVRQFISAGGPKETLPSKSVFLPLLVQALEGEASGSRDGYVTGKEVGMWLEQTVPKFNKTQNPHSNVIRVPELAWGDIVFQYSAQVVVAKAPDTSAPSVAMAPATSPRPPSSPNTKVTYGSTLYFPVEGFRVPAENAEKLNDLAQKLASVQTEVIIAIGIADSSEGGPMMAQRLAVRRAEAVKAIMVKNGVEKNRVYTQGTVGPPANTAAERANNRAVEVEAVGVKR